MAHTIASASRSVCEYFRSTSDKDRLTYATIRRSPYFDDFRASIADNPQGDASVTNSVCFVWSKYAITVLLIKRTLFTLCPTELSIFRGQLTKRFTQVTKVRDKSCAIGSHSQKTTYIFDRTWWCSIPYCRNCIRIW